MTSNEERRIMKQFGAPGTGIVPVPVRSCTRPRSAVCRSAGGAVGRVGSTGFTAIELLIALAIASILVGAAMPALLAATQRSRLDAATRQVVSEIRKVQSLAVTRSGVFGFHWGGDPNIAGLANSQYRLERDGIGGCAWPAPTDTLATNADVITDWADLAGPYPGVTITTVRDKNNVLLGGAIFDALGGSVNPCTAAAFPLTITLMDPSGATRTIEVRSAGSVRIQ